MDRAELGAMRDAIDTVLSSSESVRDQIAQWLQADTSTPNGPGPGRPSRSRSNRHRGFKPGVEEAAARERALLEAMRDQPEAGVVQWAKATHCDKSAVSRRLGRLAKRGVVERERQRSLAASGGKPYDAAVSLTAADAEAELVALRPPLATFERWIKPISSYGLRKDSTRGDAFRLTCVASSARGRVRFVVLFGGRGLNTSRASLMPMSFAHLYSSSASRPLAPDFARRLVLAQADENGMAEESIVPASSGQ